MEDLQTAFNIIVGSLSALLGWFGREMWSAVQELKADLAKLREEIPKEYVPKNDFNSFVEAVFKKLDRIEDKIDGKVDK